MTTKSLLYGTIILSLISISSTALACEGAERQASIGIIYRSLELSGETSYTNNMKDMVDKASQLKQDKSKLSQSCQVFVDQIVGYMQRLPLAGESQCYNHVCCDSDGCHPQ